jgi:hypothetical protein
MQPRRHRCLATEGLSSAEGPEQSVLHCVRGVIGVAESSQRHRPQPVSMTGDQLGEGIRVAVDMSLEQCGILGLVASGGLAGACH